MKNIKLSTILKQLYNSFFSSIIFFCLNPFGFFQKTGKKSLESLLQVLLVDICPIFHFSIFRTLFRKQNSKQNLGHFPEKKPMNFFFNFFFYLLAAPSKLEGEKK